MSRDMLNTQAWDGASFLFVHLGLDALSPIPSQARMVEIMASVNWKVRVLSAVTCETRRPCVTTPSEHHLASRRPVS